MGLESAQEIKWEDSTSNGVLLGQLWRIIEKINNIGCTTRPRIAYAPYYGFEGSYYFAKDY